MSGTQSSTPAVACDMTDAPDTGAQRLAEYARFLAAAFVSRERTADAMTWRLRAEPGIEAWARDLAARENTCCAFMTHTISVTDAHVIWHATTIDDPSARAVLDLFHELPVTRWNTVDAVEKRWTRFATSIRNILKSPLPEKQIQFRDGGAFQQMRAKSNDTFTIGNMMTG